MRFIWAERSRFRLDVRKNENQTLECEAQKRASRISRWKQDSSLEYEYSYSRVINIKYYRKAHKNPKKNYSFPQNHIRHRARRQDSGV